MPAAILLYLLQANAVLLLFAAVYYGLLRRLTFFALNRAYLLFALLFAAGYPALPVPALPAAGAALPAAFTSLAALTAPNPAGAPLAGPALTWETAALLLYLAGAAVMLARLLSQLLAVARLYRHSRPAVLQGQPYRQLSGAAGPFSFGATIYLNPARHAAAELAAVLAHEQVHVRQWHTLDVLLSQLLLAAAWCNPAAWLLRRAVLDNLEYLADHHALQAGLDRRTYQYSLLRLSQGPAGPGLASHFTFLTLKNRIAMMNTPASAAAHTLRYLLAVPLVLGLALGFSAAQARAAAPAASSSASTGSAVYYVDGKITEKTAAEKVDPKTIASVQVLKGEHMQRVFGRLDTEGVIVITTTANAGLPAVLALNEKIARSAPKVVAAQTEEPVDISYLPATALAYITTNYPGYRLIGVSRVVTTATRLVRYKAQIAIGRRPIDVLFDEQGTAVK